MIKTNSEIDQFAPLRTGVNLKKQQGVNLRKKWGSLCMEYPHSDQSTD
jgi:hypothetical protein